MRSRWFPSYVEYNDMFDRIKRDAGWFDQFIAMCRDYYESNPVGGSLHIVLDDENIDDYDITWCAGYASGKGDAEAKDLANLMYAMTMEQREKVVTSYRLYSA